MKIFDDINDWLKYKNQSLTSEHLGFVPTMGALHEGHLSLVRQSQRETDKTVVSIFVNPTQFDQLSDLEKYPNTLDTDLLNLEQMKVDYVLLPDYKQIYPDKYRFKVIENDFSKQLCGKNRPGHFDGVLTVVLKLLNIVGAKKAFFGEKDYQQLRLISDLVQAFFIPTEIIACPIVREKDGLALSSRNIRLTPEQRQLAPELAKALKHCPDVQSVREQLTTAGFDVDYVEDLEGRRFIAARLGNVRLIDNVQL